MRLTETEYAFGTLLRRVASIGAAIQLSSGVIGCTYLLICLSTIGEITKTPSAFDGREVKLQGTASSGAKFRWWTPKFISSETRPAQ